MPRDETLRKVEHDIQCGDLGMARQRLHGLLATYPGDLTLRARLGELYWRLQDPAMAGRYWYLIEGSSDAMETARRAFERSCGHSAEQMLRALRYRGDIKDIGDAYAASALAALQDRALRDLAARAIRPEPVPPSTAPPSKDEQFRRTVVIFGCLAVVAVLLLLLVLAVVTFIRMHA